MTKILITGANSFIGTNIRKFSRYKDIKTVSLRNISPGKIEFKNYDVIIHLAAIVHKSEKISESEYMRVNCDLAVQVAELAKSSGVRQFIFLSTFKVYGQGGKNVVRDEDSICKPDDFYGRSKLEAEIRLKKLETNSFKVALIRTPLVYGEGVKANMFRFIKLIDSIKVLPFGKIENKRNYTYIENLVGYIDRIIELMASGIFLAIDENSISTTELVEMIARSLHKKMILIKLPQMVIKAGILLMPGVFKRLFETDEFKNKKTIEILKFVPPFSSEEGIKKTVDAYLLMKS